MITPYPEGIVWEKFCLFTGATFNKTNGIPHRIPPPSEELSDDGSDIDENDIDMLHDIDHEKDVFRTKVRTDSDCLHQKEKFFDSNSIATPNIMSTSVKVLEHEHSQNLMVSWTYYDVFKLVHCMVR